MKKTKTFYLISGLIAITLLMLCIDVARLYRADYLFQEAARATEWQEAERLMLASLRTYPYYYYYEDRAGTVYMEVYVKSGDKRAYDNARKLFEQAHKHNPYDPYILVHRIQLDFAAMNWGLLKEPSKEALEAAEKALRLDKNNQTVKEIAAELTREGK